MCVARYIVVTNASLLLVVESYPYATSMTTEAENPFKNKCRI